MGGSFLRWSSEYMRKEFGSPWDYNYSTVAMKKNGGVQ